MKQRDVHRGMSVTYNGKEAKVHFMGMSSVFLEFEDKAVTRVTYNEIEPCTDTKNTTAQSTPA